MVDISSYLSRYLFHGSCGCQWCCFEADEFVSWEIWDGEQDLFVSLQPYFCLGHGRFASTGCWLGAGNLPWPWKICFNGRLLASSIHWSPLTMDQKVQLGLLLRSGCSCSVVLRRGPEVLIVTILSLLRWKRFQRVNFGAAIPKDHAAQTLRLLVPETPCVMVCDTHQPAILMFFYQQIQCMKFSLDVSFIYKYLESRAA